MGSINPKRKVTLQRNKAVEDWLRRCLKIMHVDELDAKQFRQLAFSDLNRSIIFEEGMGNEFRHIFSGINNIDDTEMHRLYVSGQQYGATLLIKHSMENGRKVLTITERKEKNACT